MTISATDFLKNKAYNAETATADKLGKKYGDSTEQDILSDTHKKINGWYSWFAPNIDTYRYDLLFLYIEQWDPYLRSVRTQKKKTILQINYLRSMVERLVGEESQSDPDLIVSPPDDVPVQDEDVELREGILRQSMYEAKFKQVKTAALRYALSAGYSAILTSYDYKSPYTFDKKIIWKHMIDGTCCFWDWEAEMMDKSDGDFCGYFTTMDEATFHLQFPEAKSDLSFTTMGNVNQYRQDWIDGRKVRVADVWRRERYTDIIVLLSNGESMTKDKVEEKLKEQDSMVRKLRLATRNGHNVDPQLLEKITIEKEEERVCSKIVHYKMIADEILEYSDWPSDLLPLVFVDCASVVTEGVQRTQSWHKILQDRQRQLNYMASAECDALMQSHQGNWLGTPENFKGQVMGAWLQPQTPNGILMANRDSTGALPTYIPPPQPSQAFSTQQESAIRDIHNMSGFQDANMGMSGNNLSGKAINKREAIGNMASFMPFENLKGAIEQCGRIALSLMPAVFDNTRNITIRKKDGKTLKTLLNEQVDDDYTKNDMSLTGFNVNIDVGANMQAQKAADVQNMLLLVQTNPALGGLISDKIAENMDLENTKDIVDRIQQFMIGTPLPQIIAKETGLQPPPPQPNPEAQMMQQKMAMDAKKVQNESDKIGLQSQQMVQDAINNHAKNVIDVKKFNTEMQTEHLRANAEEMRARDADKQAAIESHRDHSLRDNQQHLDLFKHLNPQKVEHNGISKLG